MASTKGAKEGGGEGGEGSSEAGGGDGGSPLPSSPLPESAGVEGNDGDGEGGGGGDDERWRYFIAPRADPRDAAPKRTPTGIGGRTRIGACSASS